MAPCKHILAPVCSAGGRLGREEPVALEEEARMLVRDRQRVAVHAVPGAELARELTYRCCEQAICGCGYASMLTARVQKNFGVRRQHTFRLRMDRVRVLVARRRIDRHIPMFKRLLLSFGPARRLRDAMRDLDTLNPLAAADLGHPESRLAIRVHAGTSGRRVEVVVDGWGFNGTAGADPEAAARRIAERVDHVYAQSRGIPTVVVVFRDSYRIPSGERHRVDTYVLELGVSEVLQRDRSVVADT